MVLKVLEVEGFQNMAPTTKRHGSKRPRSERTLECMIFDIIPKNLRWWWTDMGNYEQRNVKEHLGHLVNFMEIDPRINMVDALIPFWDPKLMYFNFLTLRWHKLCKKLPVSCEKNPVFRVLIFAAEDLKSQRTSTPTSSRNFERSIK